MLNVLDWVHLQAAIDFPVLGTQSTVLTFDKFIFDVSFAWQPLVIHIFYKEGDVKKYDLISISFVKKIDNNSYFTLTHRSSLSIPREFTLAELFMALWEIQKIYESKEYRFIKEIMS